MSFVAAVVAGFRNYVNFKGRAIRSEYWYFVLFTMLAAGATVVIDRGMFEFTSYGPAYAIYALATFLPGLGVSIRRLHDTGRSGWWLLLLVTVIGSIPLIYWYCLKGEPTENAYGPPTAIA